MTVIIERDGALQYSTRFKGLPVEQWYIIWLDFPETCVEGPHGWPLLYCPYKKELGKYELPPSTDFVVKVTEH